MMNLCKNFAIFTSLLKKSAERSIVVSSHGLTKGSIVLSSHGLATMSTFVPKPTFHDVHVVEKCLLGPGPSNMPAETKNALCAPLLGHLHTEFVEIMDDVKAGIKYVFQTRNPLTFAVSGTGHAGMECAFMNLLEADETVLVLKNGIWGQRAINLSKRLGLNAVELAVTEGEVIRPDDVRRAVEAHKPKVLFVCHGESSTGVVHPLDGIGAVCRENDCLLLVDTVASLGATPFDADHLLVDCVYSATQKTLNCPPGLAPISFSDHAVWKKILARKKPVISFYFDALELGNYWGCFDEPRRYHHTAPISTVYALRQALALIAKEGIAESIERHATNAKFFHSLLEENNFELFVGNPAHRLPCLTTIRVPPGVDWKGVQNELMADRVEIAGGLGPTVGRLWRVGTFGINSDRAIIIALVDRLKAAVAKHRPKQEKLEAGSALKIAL